MEQVNNIGQGAQRRTGFLNLTSVVALTDVGTFVIAALLFFGINNGLRSAKLRLSVVDSVNLYFTTKHELAIGFNQTFSNEGNADGKAAAITANVYPAKDSTLLASFRLDYYVVRQERIAVDYVMLPEHSGLITGSFNYIKSTFNEVTWKEGYYRLRINYSYPVTFSSTPSTAFAERRFWVSAGNAWKLNHLRGKFWRKKMIIPMI